MPAGFEIGLPGTGGGVQAINQNNGAVSSSYSFMGQSSGQKVTKLFNKPAKVTQKLVQRNLNQQYNTALAAVNDEQPNSL